MKELFVSGEMKHFQESAKKFYAEKQAIDVDAVRIGWKIEPGRVIVAEGKEIEIISEPTRDNFEVIMNNPSAGIVNASGKIPATTVGWIILNKSATVYYSR